MTDDRLSNQALLHTERDFFSKLWSDVEQLVIEFAQTHGNSKIALIIIMIQKTIITLQWNFHIPDTVGTQAKCPDYRGVLISEAKVKCYVFIQIKALYNLITLFFIKTYERMTKSYKSIEIFINTCLFSRHKLFHLHFSNCINCYTYAIGFT